MLFGWDIGTIGGVIVMPSFISYVAALSMEVTIAYLCAGHIISVGTPMRIALGKGRNYGILSGKIACINYSMIISAVTDLYSLGHCSESK
jgi:hypothetical protein